MNDGWRYNCRCFSDQGNKPYMWTDRMWSEGWERWSLHWVSLCQLLQQGTPEEGLAVSQVEVSCWRGRWDTAQSRQSWANGRWKGGDWRRAQLHQGGCGREGPSLCPWHRFCLKKPTKRKYEGCIATLILKCPLVKLRFRWFLASTGFPCWSWEQGWRGEAVEAGHCPLFGRGRGGRLILCSLKPCHNCK